MINEIRLDNTKRKDFSTCPRKYQWSHIMNLKTMTGSSALRFGSCWHGLMEGFYGGIKESGWASRDKAIEKAISRGKQVWDKESEGMSFYEDYRTFENCITMFMQYIQEFKEDEGFLEVLETESIFSLPMVLEDDLEKDLFGHLPPVIFTGKLDLKAKLNYNDWLVEFKTTGRFLPSAVAELNRSPQVMGYSYAGPRVLSFRPEGNLVSFAYITARKNKDGIYGTPTIKFQRVPQIFTEGDLKQWRMSFLDICARIFKCSIQDYYPMNLDSCYAYGSCAYTRLCEQNRDVEDTNTDGYAIRPWDVEQTAVEED